MSISEPKRTTDLSADGSRYLVVLGTSGHEVVVWDVAHARALVRVRPGGDVIGCRFSPDDRHFVTSSWDGAARVFDASTGLPTCDAMRHLRGVGRSVFSPDGHRLATVSWDNTARVWDSRTGRAVSPVLWHAGYVLTSWFSPDGSRLLTVSEDHTARLWTLAQESPARLILRHKGPVVRARYSPA